MNLYYYLSLIIWWCTFIYPIKSQWFYSTQYNQFPIITPQLIPQPFLPPPIPATVTYNIPTNQENLIKNSADYRGFSYHTEFKDGASSTVFFITGPEAEQLRKIDNFPFLQRNNNNNNNRMSTTNNRARNLASNILDRNAFDDINKQIQKTLLKPNDFQTLFQDNSIPGITHFYNFPASTVPLVRELNTNNITKIETTTAADADAIATTTTIIADTTTTESNTQEDAVEVEAAESIVKDSKILINDLSSTTEIAEKSSTTTPTTTEQTTNNLKQENEIITANTIISSTETATETNTDDNNNAEITTISI